MRSDEILWTVLKDLKIPPCYVTANMMQTEVKNGFQVSLRTSTHHSSSERDQKNLWNCMRLK